MIPVRRWPLFLLLLVALKTGPWMPALRWAIAVLGLFDASVCLLLGYWWPAAAFAALGVGGFAASFPAGRASLELRGELVAIRDAGRLGGEAS